MLLADFIRESTLSLESLYPEKEAHGIVLMLCGALLGTKSYTHIIDPGFTVDPKQEKLLSEAVSRLMTAEPIQYVIGYEEFHGRRFKVCPDVLIPRPETELMVMEAVSEAARIQRMRTAYGSQAKPVRILDLCTGSGCIAWTMAFDVPGAVVVAVDISEEALSVASSQFSSREIEACPGVSAPHFIKADVLDTEQPFPYDEFDIILSNPPYIMESEKAEMRRNVLEHEPSLALFVPDEDPLLFYRAIASWSERLLAPDGFGFSEINEMLGPRTAAVFKASGMRKAEIVKDLSSKDRFITYSR